MSRALRRSALIAAGLLAALLLATVLAATTLAASGALNNRPGSWNVPAQVAPGLALDLNVAGLLRLATSPLGRRLLDGHRATTALGHLQFERDGDALVVRCAPCRVNDARLAGKTVALPPVSLRLARSRAADANDNIDGQLLAGELTLPFRAQLTSSAIEIAWTLPETDIAAAYRLLADAIAEVRYARIAGRVQAHGTLTLPSLASRQQVQTSGFEVGGLNTERLRDGWFSHPCSRAGAPARRVSGDGEAGWVALEAMGPWLPAAVLAAQDPRFAAHAGFDPAQFGAALAGRDSTEPARSAVTLTQQLARGLFGTAEPMREATVARQLRELLYAVEMERTLGKERIVALYLNTVEWGPGLCGARDAARTYFRKAPERLTPLEAAWLASILRNPQAAYERQFMARAADTQRAAQIVRQLRDLPREPREREARQLLVFAAPPKRSAAAVAAVASAGPARMADSAGR